MRPANPSPQYDVLPSASRLAAAPVAEDEVIGDRVSATAVLVTHGMGQQVPFQTLDAIAEGLLRQPGWPSARRVARAIKSGDQWLSRIELTLDGAGKSKVVHIYEAYWAPLTEGKVTIRDVIGFLGRGAANGIRNAHFGRFRRWMFGAECEFPIPSRTLLYLLTAVAVIAALVLMNSTIVLVGAALSVFAEKRPAWLSTALLADVTTIFTVVVAALELTAIGLGVAVIIRKWVWRWLRLVWSYVTAVLFVATLFVIVLAGGAIALLLYGHLSGRLGPDQLVWERLFPASLINAFDARVVTWSLWGVGGIAIILAAWWIAVALATLAADLGLSIKGGMNDTPRTSVGGTFVVAALFAVLVFLLASLVRSIAAVFGPLPHTPAVSGVPWVLLVAASAYIRSVLVQYVGDVAVYVMPYRLDAFADLRQEIKECCSKVGRAIYGLKSGSEPFYDNIILIGHSLGSVISYDMLNQLVREDAEAGVTKTAAERTKLLLTFGSPLDKTAFLFAQQGPADTPARDSLAATLQPLIQDYTYRPPKWINLYSPWDIVSGHLGFYDPADVTKRDDQKRVLNRVDPAAIIPLIAHTEYWNGDLLISTIADHL